MFGELLRKYRVNHGYTRKKLADFLCADRTTYTKYETVRVPVRIEDAELPDGAE